MNKNEFKPIFEMGEENPFGQFFTGQSYLKMLYAKDMGIANVTFEPGWAPDIIGLNRAA